LPPDDWEKKKASEQTEAKEAGLATTRKKEARCAYCVVGETFPPMTVLSNERLICSNCDHIVIPNDTAFKCRCPRFLEIDLSPSVRGLRGSHLGPKN
jgi:hypothetical protein